MEAILNQNIASLAGTMDSLAAVFVACGVAGFERRQRLRVSANTCALCAGEFRGRDMRG